MTSGIIFLDDVRTGENIVGQVLNTLEQGPPWDRNSGLPTNPVTGWHFTGVTALTLDIVAKQHGFRSQYWATADNWSKCGGSVTGPGHEIPYDVDGQLYWVRMWHSEDVRGADRFQTVRKLEFRWDKIARLLAATGANVIHENRPYPIYEPPQQWSAFPNHVEGDTIYAPPMELCRGPSHYWHNVTHELFHWAEVRTGWLSHDMPMREFVAELGSAWLLRYFGLPGDGNEYNFWNWQPDWRAAINKGDAGWLFEAIGQVEKAMEYLQCLRRKESVVSHRQLCTTF